MANKSGLQTAGNLAHFAKALYDIIRAFMQGGWYAAALQAVKHYWPQILAIALFLIFLPVIIFCCLPMMLFGFESSTNTEISTMTTKAGTLSGYYDSYEMYIDQSVENIKSTALNEMLQIAKTNVTAQDLYDMSLFDYEVSFSGSKIQKNWFIALHAVTVENNLNAATEADVKAFSQKCVSYTTRLADENTESDTESTETSEDGETITKMILDIYYRTPTEIMADAGFTDSDENWARLIHKTLEMEHNSSVGVLGSLFSDTSWRNSITSEYGYRTSPEPGFHHGLDIGMPTGTDICAVKDGTVVAAIRGTTGYGYYVMLDHGEGVETMYAHCSQLLVEVGDEVSKGDVIAKVGNTGKSTGPHCHFEVRINGEQVDPTPYLP